MTKAEIQIGSGLRDAAADVAAAWTAAASGALPDASDRTYVADWSALCSVLTPRRYQLLRHLRMSPEAGVRALARSLRRDVRRVHEDVVALAELGLVDRNIETGGLSSAVDTITSTIRIAA